MIKRWITQVGNYEFVHKSRKDACAYDGYEKINIIEMVDIDTFDEYAEALEKPDKDDCYVKAYRAGWNDSISQVIKSIDELTVYGRLGNDYVEKMELMIVIKRLLKQ